LFSWQVLVSCVYNVLRNDMDAPLLERPSHHGP
jgi:hypothetical protein